MENQLCADYVEADLHETYDSKSALYTILYNSDLACIDTWTNEGQTG